MRTLLVSLFTLALAAGATAGTYPLQDHSRLTLLTPAGWNESHIDMSGDLIFRFSPKNPKVNARGEFTISAGVVDEFDTKKKLSGYVADMAREMTASIDPHLRPPAVQPVNCRQGFGFLYTLVDPSLVGKASQPGNFKQITGGVIRLAPGVMVEIRITSDGDQTEGYRQLIAVVEGLEAKR
jgi:hypothetical protein